MSKDYVHMTVISPEPIPPAPPTMRQANDTASLRSIVMLCYVLFLIACVNGVTAIAGVIIAYVKRHDAMGTIWQSHFKNLISGVLGDGGSCGSWLLDLAARHRRVPRQLAGLAMGAHSRRYRCSSGSFSSGLGALVSLPGGSRLDPRQRRAALLKSNKAPMLN